MKKYGLRFVALLLIMALNVSMMSGMTVKATDDEIGNSLDKSIESQAGEEQQTSGGKSTGEEKEGILNYIYVEKPYLETPDEQNIVVSWGDGTQNITDMQLVCQKSDGSIENIPVAEKTGELYAFKKAFSQEDAGVYQIVQILYGINGKEKTLDLLGISAGAKFGVDMPYSEEYGEAGLAVQSEDVEASVVTLDGQETTTEVSNSVEKAVEEAVEEAVGIEVFTRERSNTIAMPDGNLVVVLDPGHGGTDAGASGNGLIEKNLNLKIATYCKEELEKYRNVKVYMTRTDNTTTEKSLENRTKIAVGYGADVIVSIHINSASVPGANGAEVWYPNMNYNPTVHQDGKYLAQQILNQLVSLGLTNRGINAKNGDETYPNGTSTDYYGIIRHSKLNGIPGIIVEHAFISNTGDVDKYLTTDEQLKKLGIADATGIAQAYGLIKKGDAYMEIKNANDFEGTFELRVDSALPAVSKVTASVWTEENTANKKEYNMQLQSDGTYLCKVQKNDFANKVGKYNATATVYYQNGIKETNAVSYTLMDSKAGVSVQLAGDEKKATISASIINPPASLAGLKAAVWGNSNGGNDLKWYELSLDAQGRWTIEVPISNHKEFGEYFVDTYVNLKNGESICINSGKFVVKEPELQTTIGNYNDNDGTFEIIARDIKSPSGVKTVRFPVWNGADASTMYWYDGVKQSDGSYKITVDLKNHKYKKGTYYAHVYVEMGNDVTVSKNVGTCQVNVPKVNIEVKDISGTEKTYQASGKNLEVLGNVKQVRYAVWSKEGKGRDLKWYNGSKDSQGIWKADIAISNHKQAGEYIMDTYVILSSGEGVWVKTDYFTVSKPTFSIEFGAYDEKSGTFDIIARNISSKSGVNQVLFPAWSKEDNSTVYWYEGVKQADGSYKAVINVKNHKYKKGSYLAHIYITMGNGVTVSENAGTCEVTIPKANVEIEDISKIEKTFQARGKNLGVFGTVKEVRYAVWSVEGKGADLKWYQASVDSQGVWKADIAASNHGRTGNYIMDTYVTLTTGISICVNTSYFAVTDPTLNIEYGTYNENSGTFEIAARNINSVSGVKRVSFPVWNKGDASTVYWYEGVKQTDGSYKAIVNVKNHKFSKGTYMAHVYVTMGNDVTVSKNAGTCDVATPKANVEVKDISGAEKTYQAIGKNLEMFGNLKGVRYAVWSKAGKGTDLKWYSASKDSQGVWRADISVSAHKQAGEYIVDTYADLTSGVSICVNSNTKAFVVTAPTMEIEIGEFIEDEGTFDIIAWNVSSPSGVKAVRFPVWNKADSSTMYWYEGEKQADGSYRVTVNVRNHKFNRGTYIIHGYIYAGNGVTTSVLAGEKEITKIIIKELYSIMGESTVTVDQMVKLFVTNNTSYPQNKLGGNGGADDIVKFCTIAVEEAKKEGVRAEVLFAQMMLETGYLKFGGDVDIKQFNFGGLGATGGGVKGNEFPDVRTGIRAQVQHLKCYASDAELNNPKVDPRWLNSLRLKAPYVQWLGKPDNPYGIGWAASKGYGDRILNIINQMKN